MTVPDIKQYVLVTGGLGYIGCHTVVKLLQQRYKVVIFDNLENSKIETLDRIKRVLKYENQDQEDYEFDEEDLLFFQVDLRSLTDLTDIIENKIIAGNKKRINSIIHFAGLKSVKESVQDPLRYYDYNFLSSLNLLKIVGNYDITHFIFSSSATIYGDVTKFPNPGEHLPLRENQTTKIPINPYGNTKFLIERMLHDYAMSKPDFKVGILRYFNPIGAHPSGLIGEDPLNEPLNLLPVISSYTILGKTLKIFGDDYHTKDGTCIRDYIHIEDLSEGHVLTLGQLQATPSNYNEWNLGSGVGYSVLDIIHQWQLVSNTKVKYEVVEKRFGDVEILLADVKKSERELGFRCKFGLKDACDHLWSWTLNYYKEFETLKVGKA